ncbi:glutamine amidotransferase [Rhodanobacter sp. L36]|uniref:glutamine amidotransferase n=1 Tax=Rhodanobacter sp. L36 TaxID=1747221 RepID=UPI00131C61A6|nr:glutamine amidotransferase [Rhodanobacter sp. L36]
MKPILIIRTGRAPDPIRARHGDFPHWFRISTKLPLRYLRTIDVTAGETLPPPRDVAGAMITGSASMVTERLPWSERTAGWIRDAMDIDLPLFGVCYGHQLMAHALGGRVDYLPGGREIGTQSIEMFQGHERDPLLSRLPIIFRAHTTHEQSVIERPGESSVLGRSSRDPHQLLRYGSRAISTQFHPEFNADIMRAYIHRKRTDMRREGADPALIFKAVAATPVARRLLQAFASHCGWLDCSMHVSPAASAS